MNGISGIGGGQWQTPPPESGKAGAAGFADALAEAVARVHHLQLDSGNEVRRLLAGDSEDLHRTMLAIQKADLAFEMLLEVRNKVVAAYQEIMRIQV